MEILGKIFGSKGQWLSYVFFFVPIFFVGALGSKNSYSIVWEGCFLRFTLVDCYTRPVPCGNLFYATNISYIYIYRIDFLLLAYLGRRLAFGEGVVVDGWWHGMVGLISSTGWLTVRSEDVVCTWWDKPHADGLYRFMRMLEFTFACPFVGSCTPYKSWKGESWRSRNERCLGGSRFSSETLFEYLR